MQILLPIIGFLPFLSFVFVPGIDLLTVHNAQGFSYNLYREGLMDSSNLLLVGSFLLLVLFSVILFVVNIRFEILGQRSMILSYFYLFLVCTPMTNLYLHPAGISGLLLFSGLLFLFGIYHKEKHLLNILNSGIFFGLSTLIFPPFLLFFPIFLLAVVRMKQPSWRDFAVIILGFLIPVWIYVAYLFLTHQLAYEWISFNQWFEIRKSWPPPLPGNTALFLIWIGGLLLLLPLSITIARSRKDSGRRIISVLIQFLWMGPLLFLLLERVSFEIWGLVSLPVAILFSLAVINSRRKWTARLIVLSMILFLIWFQIDRLL